MVNLRIRNKIKKLAIALVGASVLFSGNNYDGAQTYSVFKQEIDEKLEGRVIFHMETKTLEDKLSYEFKPGDNFVLNIYADNTSLNGKKTGGIRWGMNSNLKLEGVTPLVHYGENDFFYPLEMQNGERVNVNDSTRVVRLTLVPVERKGVNNRNGLLAKYNASVPQDAKSGQYQINIVKVAVGSDIGEDETEYTQKFRVKNFSVAVRKKDAAEPVVALTSDAFSDYLVYVAGRDDKKYKLEVSEDLKNWTAVWTNSALGSFAYDDREAALKNKRFYRASEVRE